MLGCYASNFPKKFKHSQLSPEINSKKYVIPNEVLISQETQKKNLHIKNIAS